MAINDEKVWGIFVDIYTLNVDGNLIDACALAAVAALKTTVFPKYDEKEDEVKHEEMTSEKLPLTNQIPINITLYKVGKYIIADPTEEEEDSSEARISIALSNDKEPMIHSVQKGGENSFTEEETDFIIDNAVKKAAELQQKIKNLK